MRTNPVDRPLLRSASSVEHVVILAFIGLLTVGAVMALTFGVASALVRSAGCVTERGAQCATMAPDEAQHAVDVVEGTWQMPMLGARLDPEMTEAELAAAQLRKERESAARGKSPIGGATPR